MAAQTVLDTTKNIFIKIDSITVEGNKRTRKPLILRELEFRIGDSIPMATLQEVLERNQKRIINLHIFNDVVMTIKRWSAPDRIVLHIKVREAWYWFPSPVFELVDRNFNVWWNEFNGSLRRTNYGGDYTQYNFTGHADVISLTATAGYNQRFSARYRTPTINKKQTIGLQGGFSYSRTREIAVNTLENKLVFFSSKEFYAVRRIVGDLTLSWRPGLLRTHSFMLEHRETIVADTIAQVINPFFFDEDRRVRQRHNSFVYTYLFDNLDLRTYPRNGWRILVEARQNGLLPSDDLHLFRGRAEINKFTGLTKRFSLETAVRVRVSLPRGRPPYFNNQALGYGGDFVRGYEYYVMDGLDFALLKTSLRFKAFHRKLYYPKLLRKYIKRLSSPIDTQVYISFQNDVGSANDPWFGANNPLSNRLLYASGIALDLVLFNRMAFEVAWARTVTGQSGIFVRTAL